MLNQDFTLSVNVKINVITVEYHNILKRVQSEIYTTTLDLSLWHTWRKLLGSQIGGEVVFLWKPNFANCLTIAHIYYLAKVSHIGGNNYDEHWVRQWYGFSKSFLSTRDDNNVKFHVGYCLPPFTLTNYSYFLTLQQQTRLGKYDSTIHGHANRRVTNYFLVRWDQTIHINLLRWHL